MRDCDEGRRWTCALGRRCGLCVALPLGLLAGACTEDLRDGPVSAGDRSRPAFVDVAREAGIGHTHHKPVLDPKLSNIMSWMASVGAAVATADYDRDGWMDLYVTDSRKGASQSPLPKRGQRDVSRRGGRCRRGRRQRG